MATLKQIHEDMIQAMREGKKHKKEALSSLFSAIKKAAIDEGCRDNITEEFVNKVVLKELKTIQEMIDTCPKERIDRLGEYALLKIEIEKYAPKLMTKEETTKAVYHLIAITDIQQNTKGAIMKAITPSLRGKADMKMVNEIVDEILSKME